MFVIHIKQPCSRSAKLIEGFIDGVTGTVTVVGGRHVTTNGVTFGCVRVVERKVVASALAVRALSELAVSAPECCNPPYVLLWFAEKKLACRSVEKWGAGQHSSRGTSRPDLAEPGHQGQESSNPPVLDAGFRLLGVPR